VNIWRIAGIIASVCVLSVILFVIGFGWYSGTIVNLNTKAIFELIGFLVVFATFILALITFPYYWFKTARSTMQKNGMLIDKNLLACVKEKRNERLGMLASCALIVFTILAAKFLGIGK
jgi:uncharacterized membrane protein